MRIKLVVAIIALTVSAVGAQAQSDRDTDLPASEALLGLTPYKEAGGRVAGGEGFHQSLGDFLNSLSRYVPLMKYRQMPFLSSSESGPSVSGYGFLIEINLEDCESTGRCDVFFVIPRLIIPGADGSKSANEDKSNGWFVPLKILGTMSSVEDGDLTERVGVVDYFLGLKVKGRQYRYDASSQSYLDDVVYQKELKELWAKNKAKEDREYKEEAKAAAAEVRREQATAPVFLWHGVRGGMSKDEVFNVTKEYRRGKATCVRDRKFVSITTCVFNGAHEEENAAFRFLDDKLYFMQWDCNWDTCSQETSGATKQLGKTKRTAPGLDGQDQYSAVWLSKHQTIQISGQSGLIGSLVAVYNDFAPRR